jgi:glycerol-3-phosphate dehydrogenase (NAD(P)+)
VASLAARNTDVVLWAREPEICAEIAERHTNQAYLPGIHLHPDLRTEPDLAAAVSQAEVLVMGIPSQGFRGVLIQAAPHLRAWVPIVSLVKGLELGTKLRMTQIAAEVTPDHPAGVLSGPNIAREVAEGFAAAATLTMPDQWTADRLQSLFHSSLFRVYTGTDVVGVELAGALKNVFAIAVGFGDGLDAGVNTRAMVITRGLRELARLGTAMGGKTDTFYGLAGIGDLIATCTSPLSRNRTVGFELAKGRSVEDIVAGMKQVAEGVKTSSVVIELAAECDIAMPIAREVDAVINHGQPVEDAYRGLLRAAPGHEVHGDAW